MTISSHSPRAPVKGSFSFAFPVKSDIAPVARLFIFTVFPNGEVIGDSQSFEIDNCLANKVSVFSKKITRTQLNGIIGTAYLTSERERNEPRKVKWVAQKFPGS